MIKPQSNPVLLVGSGRRVFDSWRRRLVATDFHLETLDEDKLPDFFGQSMVWQPLAVIWQAAIMEKQFLALIRKLPEELPLLLRYPVLRQVCTYQKPLSRLLRRRAATTMPSWPLQFWPPFCRIWEIVASGVLGEGCKLEIELDARASNNQPGMAWFPEQEDLIDACACLMDKSPAAMDRSGIEGASRLRLDFGCSGQALIRTRPGGPEAGGPILGITVQGDCGELALHPVQPAESGQDWILHRRFARRITVRRLQPLLIADLDPVALELDYFIHQYIRGDSGSSRSAAGKSEPESLKN